MTKPRGMLVEHERNEFVNHEPQATKTGNFLVRSAFQTSEQVLNAHAHDAKPVFSFAQLTLFAKSYTSAKQGDD